MADRQLEYWFGNRATSAFETSLILNLLFEDKILVPDIFVFISHSLSEHVKRAENSGTESLFEAALASGVIVPALRGHAGSFTQALQVIVGLEQNPKAIQGVIDGSTELAARLDHTTKGAILPVSWPGFDVGEAYESTVRRYLMRDNAPRILPNLGINQSELDTFWAMTRRYRMDCVAEALQDTRAYAGVGLRRGELMNAVGRALDIRPSEGIQDVVELVRTRHFQERRALELFCLWMSQCYHLNQAEAFGARPSFPEFDPLTGAIMTEQFEEGTQEDEGASSDSALSEVFTIPSLARLKKMPPDSLLGVRGDYGKDYLRSVDAWLGAPSDTAKREQVATNLQAYAAELVKWASLDGPIPVNPFQVVAQGGQPNRDALASVLDAGVRVAGAVTPVIPLLVALGQTGYILYRLVSRAFLARDTQVVTFRLPAIVHRRGPELTLSSPSGTT